jgi:hypothetical protein
MLVFFSFNSVVFVLYLWSIGTMLARDRGDVGMLIFFSFRECVRVYILLVFMRTIGGKRIDKLLVIVGRTIIK